MHTETSPNSQETKYQSKNVLIVGGGPAGLATALMLAKRGWKNITVLEQRVAADYYEPDKSFNYLIDGRGQKLTDFLGLSDELAKLSVPTQEFYLTVIQPDSSRKTLNLPIIDANRKTAYWISRKSFVLLLYQEIEKNWQDYITVFFKTKCVEINQVATNIADEKKLEILAQSQDGDSCKFTPDFLIGCDGINSFVRQNLKEWEESNSDRFVMKLFPSPSSNLRYKVLNLPPQFPVDRNGKELAIHDMAYAIRGAFRGRRRLITLGILPLKNPEEGRTANIITPFDHEIWQLRNSEDLANFLEQAFPQLPIREIVTPTEADRFVKSEGGYFPIPQYCAGLYFLLTQESAENAPGIVLLGDAVHCFPPDIGQGVNSALEDVYVLHEALSKADDDLSRALPLYESLRADDVKALVRLSQIAFPWQYNQDPWRQSLWIVNFFIRLSLSRFLPSLFSPQAFFLIQNHRLSYQKILAKVNRTTQILWLIILVIICGVLALWGLIY
ncbi:FAD-dependent oxidoreductase [Fortiea contorta]|uniref:FAD-dependent oxidoreductase n=1 Tax=Fortiea contorta TaxID=1892405 RepID=UPI00034CE1D4|nr:NAD(P)/FAD-dependent oxidoreductase [Fortiea contorta]